VHRELQRLTHERIPHTNRIGSLLVLHNLRPRIIIGGRDWAAWWDSHRKQVPPMLRAEIEREITRLKLSVGVLKSCRSIVIFRMHSSICASGQEPSRPAMGVATAS
jgi:hypothetical protein